VERAREGFLQKITSMPAKFLHQLLDLVRTFKASPEEDLFAAGERTLGFVKKPGQILIIDLYLK